MERGGIKYPNPRQTRSWSVLLLPVAPLSPCQSLVIIPFVSLFGRLDGYGGGKGRRGIGISRRKKKRGGEEGEKRPKRGEGGVKFPLLPEAPVRDLPGVDIIVSPSVIYGF